MLTRTILVWMLLFGTLVAGQNVVVLVDDSGSMIGRMQNNRGLRKIDAAKAALAVVLDKLPQDAQVGILALNSGWIRSLQPVDRSQVKREVNRLRPNGGTPLGTYMKKATDALLELRATETYGDYRLVVVTDGEANDQAMLDFILPDIMSRGLHVDVIGVDMESDHSLATQVHTYRRADDLASLEDAIAAALAESDEDVVGVESDFELLEGFPVDMVPVVLTALTSANNAPVGGWKFAESDEDVVGVEDDHAGGDVSPRIRDAGNAGDGLIFWEIVFGLFVIVAVLVLIFIVVVVVVLVLFVKKAGRRV